MASSGVPGPRTGAEPKTDRRFVTTLGPEGSLEAPPFGSPADGRPGEPRGEGRWARRPGSEPARMLGPTAGS